MSSLSVVLWNVQWASTTSKRGRSVSSQLVSLAGDLVCVHRGPRRHLARRRRLSTPSSRTTATPSSRAGRKVMLWSRWPWRRYRFRWVFLTARPVDSWRGGPRPSWATSASMRVCVPWRDAHVRTGRRDRRPWEDHQAYLVGLSLVLRERDHTLPAVVLGDFNRRVLGSRQPKKVYRALTRRTRPRLRVCDGRESHRGIGRRHRPLGVHHSYPITRSGVHRGLRRWRKVERSLPALRYADARWALH